MAELVLPKDPDVLEAVLKSLYPDPVEFAITVKTMRFMADFTVKERARPGPRTDNMDAVRQFKEFELSWQRAAREGRAGNWDTQNLLEVALNGTRDLLTAVPANPTSIFAQAIVGFGQNLMKLTPVQDMFALDRAVEAARGERHLVEQSLDVSGDIAEFAKVCGTDRLCAQQAAFMFPKVAAGATELPVFPAEVIRAHPTVFNTVLREAVRPDGEVVVDVETLREALAQDFAEITLALTEGMQPIRSELAELRESQASVLDWVLSQEARESERRRIEEDNLRRSEIVRAVQPMLTEAEGALAAITGLLGLADPKLADDMVRVGSAVVQVARTGTELVQAACNISTGLTSLASAGVCAATGNFIGAAVALIGLFSGTGPTPEEQILEEVRALREEMRSLQRDMSERFDRIDRALEKIYGDVMHALGTIDLSTRQLTEEVMVVLASLDNQRKILTRIERSLHTYIREGERDELKDAIDTGLSRSRSDDPQMTMAEYYEFEGEFFGWATRRCQGVLESPVQGRQVDDQSLATELTSPTARAADNLGFVVEVIRARRGPGVGQVLANRPIPNPDTWALAAAAYGQLESEWPQLSALANSADPNGQRDKVRANGRFLQELLHALLEEIDDRGRNSLAWACDELSRAATALGAKLEEGALAWQRKGMLAAAAAGQPYLPRWTSPPVTPDWDYVPAVPVHWGWMTAPSGHTLPAGMLRNMPANLRALLTIWGHAIVTISHQFDGRGVGHAVLRADIHPFVSVEAADPGEYGEAPQPLARYEVHSRLSEPLSADRQKWPRADTPERWASEWVPALEQAVPTYVDKGVRDDADPEALRWRRKDWCWMDEGGLFPDLRDALRLTNDPVGEAAATYAGARALVDTLVTIAMPEEREHNDTLRAALDGRTLQHAGIAIPTLDDISDLLTDRDPAWGPHVPAAGERPLDDMVGKVTTAPIRILREALEAHRQALAETGARPRQPTVDNALLRLDIGEGIVKLSVPAPAQTLPTPNPPAQPPRTVEYIVRTGETLSSIARKFGVAGGWRELYDTNRGAIGSDPNRIQPGLLLSIPASSESRRE